jgi:hypothetical protein
VAQVIDRRVTAEMDGDFVVFLIGMRINRLRRVREWLPVFMAMPRMIRELQQAPEAGLLEAYARSHDNAHWPAWVAFNKRIGSTGEVGIWHETYLVPAGGYECVYNNMPPTGLGTVGNLVTAAGRKATAARRAGIRDEPYPEGAPTEGIEV